MNGIERLYIQLRYPWLNSFVSTISREQSMNSPKWTGLLFKQVDKDKLNVIGMPFMQLRYMWLNSFVSKSLQWSKIHEFTCYYNGNRIDAAKFLIAILRYTTSVDLIFTITIFFSSSLGFLKVLIG